MEHQKRDKRIIIPFTEHELLVIEDWRFESRTPSRAEAIRELIRRGIDASNAGMFRDK